MSYQNFKRSRGNFSGSRNRFSQNRKKSGPKVTGIDPRRYVSSNISPVLQIEKPQETISYKDLAISEALKKNLVEKGYDKTTQIQSLVIPHILNGKNLLGISATGSGKTAAFLVPMIDKILKDPKQRLLVVAPTRELAMQIQKETISLIRGTFIRVERIIGGESIARQSQSLKYSPNIIIGTPGRINDMYKRGFLNLASTNNIILDEVDRMLDMGFVNDIRTIFSLIKDSPQALFFSATIDARIKQIITTIAQEYTTVEISGNTPINNVKQDVVEYQSPEEKIEKLHDILIKEEVVKTIVFIETKRFVDKMERILSSRGFKTAAIHGDKPQNKRKKVIELYRENKVNILIATNVAARGLDISDVSHIINYDEPQTFDEYIHRIGRTGRNGKTGFAYTFVQKSIKSV